MRDVAQGYADDDEDAMMSCTIDQHLDDELEKIQLIVGCHNWVVFIRGFNFKLLKDLLQFPYKKGKSTLITRNKE